MIAATGGTARDGDKDPQRAGRLAGSGWGCRRSFGAERTAEQAAGRDKRAKQRRELSFHAHMRGAEHSGRYGPLAEDCCAVVIRNKPTRPDAIDLCHYPRTMWHSISMALPGAQTFQAVELLLLVST